MEIPSVGTLNVGTLDAGFKAYTYFELKSACPRKPDRYWHHKINCDSRFSYLWPVVFWNSVSCINMATSTNRFVDPRFL